MENTPFNETVPTSKIDLNIGDHECAEMAQLRLPFEYSVYGLITGQMFAINAAICFTHGYTILASFMAIIYVTTMLHWWKLRKGGFVRNLDILCAISGIIRITFYDGPVMLSGYADLTTYWFIYVATSCCVFMINELWFSYIIENTMLEQYGMCHTFIHLLVLHILPNAVCIWLIANPL
jgi:hypothetical protein